MDCRVRVTCQLSAKPLSVHHIGHFRQKGNCMFRKLLCFIFDILISMPGHSISCMIVCTPIEYTVHLAHPRSLPRVFYGRFFGSQGIRASSGGQGWLWSACAGAHADLSHCWTHMKSCRKCNVLAKILSVRAQKWSIDSPRYPIGKSIGNAFGW